MNAFNVTIISIPVLLLATLGQFIFYTFPQVTIESLESKTIEGKEVFNQISIESNGSQDIWKMRQTHHGMGLPAEQWDELRITVQKTTRPFQATFQQFKNGSEVQYRVSCFMCHANGPRAIRPNWKSNHLSNSLKDKLAVMQWNLKIKTYGTIVAKKNDFVRTTPLAYDGSLDNEILKVKTCLLCHNDSKAIINTIKRAPILRQHALAIEFLVANGEMPPFPFTLSAHEKLQLQQFIQGF